ncbi:thiamine pyrophosphate-binding protein [Burkholderia territorii]|uniref:thiamine pyrophosphate-binding protein n=1 Tax=Burkholderia territorii TaxID=1503055 RepID=UPI001E55290A|nr:thiamine pyrophosphate-binding protein [Burkholderia territorii]
MIRIKWVTAECRKMRMAHSICLGHFRSKEKAKNLKKATHVAARFDVSRSVMNLPRSLHVAHIFLVRETMVYPLLDAVDKRPEIRGIVAAHEAGSAFMADGYARASRKLGVSLAISEPGTMHGLP